MSEETNENIQAEINEEQINTIETLIMALVPPKSITIIDTMGNEYSKPCFISARNQIKLIREIQDAFESVNRQGLLPSTTSGVDGSFIIDLLVSFCTNEEFLTKISSCFNIAHADIVRKAKAKAKENNIPISSKDSEVPMDLFSIEEIATAIVPLFIRLTQKTGKAFSHVVKTITTAETQKS